jgi:sialic acid synthase SpsE
MCWGEIKYMPAEVNIGRDKVGLNHPCYIVAEIGSNHNQDWELALKHIDAAVEAGANAVKFQTFKAERHISEKANSPSYLNTKKKLYEIIKSLELNRDWQRPLYDYCEKKNITFFSSPCDTEAVDQLEKIGVLAHKVASFDLPDLGLIRSIAEKHKTIILSTGLADWMEIQRAVDVCREVGNENIIILQCTSLYPAPVHLANLKAMQSMSVAFNVLTGYSDHTNSDTVACAAVAMGACLIEKHFTVDKKLPGPDHPFAMEPYELKRMVARIRETEAAMGDGIKNGPRPEEKEMAEACKRSIHAATDIKNGEAVTQQMLVIKRPGHGISPHLLNDIIGRKVRRNIVKDEWITWEML